MNTLNCKLHISSRWYINKKLKREKDCFIVRFVCIYFVISKVSLCIYKKITFNLYKIYLNLLYILFKSALKIISICNQCYKFQVNILYLYVFHCNCFNIIYCKILIVPNISKYMPIYAEIWLRNSRDNNFERHV